MKTRLAVTMVVVVGVAAMMSPAAGAKGGGKGKGKSAGGWRYETVASVDVPGLALNVASNGKTRRLMVASTVLVTVNNRIATLEEVRAGMWVDKLTCNSQDLITQLKVIDPISEKSFAALPAMTPSGMGTNSASVAQKVQPYSKVESVNVGESTVTINETDGITRTFQVTPGTQITVYGGPGRLENIKSGMKVYISATVGGMAGRIDAIDPPGAKGKPTDNKSSANATPSGFRNLYDKVLSVNPADFSLVVVRADGQNRRTIYVNSFTTIKIYGRPGQIENIKSGMRADVACSTGNTASRIDAMDLPPPVEEKRPPPKNNQKRR